MCFIIKGLFYNQKYIAKPFPKEVQEIINEKALTGGIVYLPNGIFKVTKR